MKKIVTVFGSSLPLEGEEEYQTAFHLGKRLAKAGFDVCSGGNQGIMDAVSKAAIKSGGKAIGVTVKHFDTNPSQNLSERIQTNTLYERLDKMVQLGDAFIILQGGTGTLFELAAVWEMINKEFIKKKPIACHSKMWNDIVDVMEKQIEKEKRQTGLIKTFFDINLCVDFIISALNNGNSNS